MSQRLRRIKGDSNPRYAFDVYTLSRRASSTTRASLLDSYDRILEIRVQKYSLFLVLPKIWRTKVFQQR